MIEITVSDKIKETLPPFVLGIIESEVVTEAFNPALVKEMEIVSERIKADFSEVSSHPEIAASRKAYKSCGKDPARYRLSAEALMRRVKKAQELPQVNNVVDIVNLVSLQTGISIGGYDAEKIVDDVWMDIGLKTDVYHAIGRGEFNVENLPVLRDGISAFGSPTSDSERTSVTTNTRRFLMVIFGFGGEQSTLKAMDLAVNLLRKYAGSENTETALIE